MSATVHRLFPGGSKSSAGPAPSAHPLIDALRQATAPILLNHLRTLFEGADDALFGMSQRAAAADDHRTSFDIMRLLRLERRRIESEFERGYAASFEVATDGGAEEFDLDRLSVLPTEELEEKIALGNLITKAENQHPAIQRELGQRISHMIRDLGIPIARRALTPGVICHAFKAAIGGIELPLDVRLLLYKLFDHASASRLDTVFEAALRVLEAQQIRVPQAPEAPTPSPYGAPQIPQASDEPLTLPVLDAATRSALEAIGKMVDGGYRPQDVQFAEELLGFTMPEADAAPSVGRVAPAQRMSLVGQMCNEILSDPHLPAAMRPLFERLRFPLIKIALADGSFFANRGHPVRRLVAEAAETAASSRIASPAVVRRLEERLRHIAEQIDLSATFVRPQVAYLHPLSMAQIAAFLDQQREESETRRENVLNKIRRTVAQELEVHTLGRKLPAPLVSFLRTGWGPLMAARLLRHGMNSRPWIDAINRLVRILASMDVIDVTADHLAVRQEILASLGIELAEIGMREDKIALVRGHLQSAYVELDERLARMSPEERLQAGNELELLSPGESAAVLAEFPSPGTPAARAPVQEVVREPLQTAAQDAEVQDPQPAAVISDAEPVATSPAPTASADDASDTDLLARCLTAESWFRVFDARNGQTLWLKVSRFYPEHGSVGFTGFDAKKTLSIRAAQLIDDLVCGRSEPVNPSPVQQRALTELRARHAPG